MSALDELVKFYAPIIGFLGGIFWFGIFTERFRNLKTKFEELKEKVEEMSQDGGSDQNSIIRLQVEVENLKEISQTIQRGIESLQRQMANLMTGRVGKLLNFGEKET